MEPEKMLKHLKNLEDEISAWPSISIHPHRFGGREFRFGSAEVGHVHAGGIVDIPFPRPVRDALLADGLAEEHHWVPNSGWISFRVRSAEDVKHALWLMRLSHLRYLLKTATDPRNLFDQESEELHLSPQFKSLLEPFVPKTAKDVSTEPLPA
jgi:luciferase-like monooxygenase